MDRLKYKILLAEGDSWTSGDIIDPDLVDKLNGNVNAPENDHWRLPKVWPSKLAKHLGIEVINNAHAGSSNDGIARRTVNKVLELLKEHKPEDILVVIGFSSPERKDFFYSRGSEASWDTVYPLDNFFSSPDREQFKKNYVNLYWNEFEYYTRYLNTVLYLHSFLQTKNINHLFFNAFYQEDNGKLNTKSFSKMLKRFQEKHSEGFLNKVGISNLFKEYSIIEHNCFVNTSFKTLLDNQKGNLLDGLHPSEEGHNIWAKFLFNFICEKNVKCIHDEVNTTTFWSMSDNILKLYENIPEIKEKDSRGYDMVRPLYSHSGLNSAFKIYAEDINTFDLNNNFYYFILCHHNLSLVGKHLNILPDYVLKGIQDKKCKLVLDDSLEGRPIKLLCDNLYKSINDLNLVPSQIYYITNNLFAEKQHKEYIVKNNINSPINIISYMYNVLDVQRLIYDSNIVEGGRLPKKLEIDKLIHYKKQNIKDIKPFLKVNRTGRPERNLFMLFVNKHKLYSKFKISFPEYGEEGSYNLFPELTSSENINSLISKIPFDIDSTDKDNHGPPGTGAGKFDADLPFQIRHYDDTFISIVMCAFPFDKACHLHSSTFNPIYCGHPIIQFGPKGSLEELRRRGFITFGKWWDESYDQIENGWDRFKAILKLVKDLSKKTNQELLEMYIDMKQVLEHNSNLIYNYDIENKLINRVKNNGI